VRTRKSAMTRGAVKTTIASLHRRATRAAQRSAHVRSRRHGHPGNTTCNTHPRTRAMDRPLRYDDIPERTAPWRAARCSIRWAAAYTAIDAVGRPVAAMGARSGGKAVATVWGDKAPALCALPMRARQRHVGARVRARRLPQRQAAPGRGGRFCGARDGGTTGANGKHF